MLQYRHYTYSLTPLKLSYWRTEPHHLDSYQSSPQLPSTCDIAIIGAGFSGAATAYNLLQEYRAANKTLPSIVILEARESCSGATGRNGGHLKIQPSFLRDRVREMGWEQAEALNVFIQDQILTVKEVIEKEGIQCESELRRSYDVLLDESEVANAKEDLAWLREKGFSRIELVDSVDDKFAPRVCSSVQQHQWSMLTTPGHRPQTRQTRPINAMSLPLALQTRPLLARHLRPRRHAPAHAHAGVFNHTHPLLNDPAHLPRHRHSNNNNLRLQRVQRRSPPSIPQHHHADQVNRITYICSG